ncbi:replication protein [Tissierella praeacuta]|uniref:replication protein n=1 Tax=Tissierella praeacuta TaxID=43131 RepID=UPI003DA439C4
MPNDKEILKAELDDGYGRVANLLLEALSISKLNGKQMSICLFIIRRTYSWRKKSDEITLNEFALACDSSETYMSKQIKQLISWGVIRRNNYSPGKTPEYEINTRVEEWDKGCLNRQGLVENIVNKLYVESDLEQKDRGYPNRQGLNEKTRQPLNKRTRVVMPLDIENTRIEGSLKESSKEITTTAIGEMESPKNNLVADTDADSVQQDKDDEKRIKDLQRIEDYYKREIRGKAVCGGTDLVNITNTYEKYKDVDFIISVMEKAKQDYISRYGKLEINSFSYFDSIFEERWRLLHAKKDEVKDKIPTNKNYNKKKVQAKKTKFHNFEGRTEKYTAEQLDDIAERKRREHSERLKKQNEAL